MKLAGIALCAWAAIASGAVAPPEVGVSAGAFVEARAGGSTIATATGFGVVTGSPPSCATAVWSAGEGAPEDDFSAVFTVPAFAALDFAWERWAVSVLASGLPAVSASETGWAVAAVAP